VRQSSGSVMVADGVSVVNDDEEVVSGIAVCEFNLALSLKLPSSLETHRLVTGAGSGGDIDDNGFRRVARGMIRLRQNAARAYRIHVGCTIVATPINISRLKPRSFI